jgi:hypothetical protein
MDTELPAVVASSQRDYRHSNIDRAPDEDRNNDDNRLKNNEYTHSSSQISRGHRHSHGGNVNLNNIQVDIPLPPSNNNVATHHHRDGSINDSSSSSKKKKSSSKKVGVKVDDYINHINSQRSASLSVSSSFSTSSSSFDTTHLVTRERYQLLFHKRQSQLEQRMKNQLIDLQKEQQKTTVEKKKKGVTTTATATAADNDSSNRRVMVFNHHPVVANGAAAVTTLTTATTATATAKDSSPSLLHKARQERRFIPNNNSPTWMGLLEHQKSSRKQESVVNVKSATKDENNVTNHQSITPTNGSLDIILPSSLSSNSRRSPILRTTIVDDHAWQGMGKTLLLSKVGSEDVATTTTTTTTIMTRTKEVENKAAGLSSKATNNDLLSSFVESSSNSDNNTTILPTYSSSSSSSSESLMYSLGEDTDQSIVHHHHEQQRPRLAGMSMQSLTNAIQNASELYMSEDDDSGGAYYYGGGGGGSGSYSSLPPSTRSSKTAGGGGGGGWNDIVASTLAECKLLLNMSPLPSPAAAIVSKVNVHVKRSNLSSPPPLPSPATISKDNVVGRFNFHQRYSEQQRTTLVNNPHKSPTSENATMMSPQQRSPFSMSTMSIIIATCPTCFKDFDMDGGGGNNMPVNSSTCEHVICRACILDMQSWTQQLDKNTGIISCPECGMKGAFDIHQSTDSRESIGLVATKVNESINTKNILPAGESKIAMNDENNMAALNDKMIINDVIRQTESYMEKDHQTGEETPRLLDTVVVNEYRPPLTPVSQAESRIIERRERLVQSFGKLNKILDSVKQLPNEQLGTMLMVPTTTVHEKEVGTVVPMAKNESRRLPILRVDTGNEESPHAAVPQMVGGVINTARSIMSLFSPVQVSSFLIDADKQKARTVLADNFSLEFPSPTEQVDSLSLEFPSPITASNICSYGDYNSREFGTAPESIEFDCFIAPTMSNDSSLTDNDTILLLADKRPLKHLPKEEVSTEQHHNRLKNVIGLRVTCPQFLPSLKYSTEQDHALNNNAIPGSSKNDDAQTARSAKGGGPIVCLKEFVSRSFGFGDSPRHIEFSGGSSFTESPYNKEEKMVDKDIAVSGTFPTYEFSLHSCSMSPTLSQEDQFWQNNTPIGGDSIFLQNNTIGEGGGGDRIGDGSLVTHKPRRLHKTIMNTLRIKKSRYSFM